MRQTLAIVLMCMVYTAYMSRLWYTYRDYREPLRKLVYHETSMTNAPKKKPPISPETETTDPAPPPSEQTQPITTPRDAMPEKPADDRKIDPNKVVIDLEPLHPTNPRKYIPTNQPSGNYALNIPQRPMTSTGPSGFVLPDIRIVPGKRPGHPDNRNDIPIPVIDIASTPRKDKRPSPEVDIDIAPVEPKKANPVRHGLDFEGSIIPIEQIQKTLRSRGLQPLDAGILSTVNTRLSSARLRERYRQIRAGGDNKLTVLLSTSTGEVIHVVLDIRSLPPKIAFYETELEGLLADRTSFERYLLTICDLLEKETP